MVLVIDDTLLFPFAMLDSEEQIPIISPNLYVMIFKSLRDYSLRELYPLERIQDRIRENRLAYELGEIKEEEYKKKNAFLLERLRIAKKVREARLDKRTSIL